MYSAVFILVIELWLFILLRLFEGVWELEKCFVDLEKVFDCSPWGVL